MGSSSSLKDALAGAAAGVVGTVLGYPLDAVKTRMQQQQHRRHGSITTTTTSIPQTLTMGQAARLIYLDGGIFAFYRGISSPLVSLVILNTLNFSAYEALKRKFGVVSADRHHSNSTQETIKIAVAAALVGPMAAMVSTPFEFIKTQMQLNLKGNPAPGQGSSSVEYAYRLIKEHQSIRIIYYGHTVNTVREMVFLSTYFTVYESTKSKLGNNFKRYLAVPLAGGLSGAIGWIISFPLDCVKSNVQGRHYSKGEFPLNSFTVANQLIKSKGVLGLYQGIIPSVARAFIVSSSRFSAYETTMWLLSSS